MTGIYWPGTSVIKSQNNAFTAHLGATPQETRTCQQCGETKTLAGFVGTRMVCRRCRNKRQEELRAKARAPHMGAYSKA